MNRQTNIYFFLFLFLSASLFAQQQVRVEAVLDTAKMRIGEQVHVDLYVTYDASLKDIAIQWPKIGDTITEKVEVISVSQIDTTFPNKSNSTWIHQHQQITVSVYDSGYYAIPPFKFVFNNDEANAAFTETLFLEVHTVPTDSSATKLKDIKPPFTEKFNWKWYINYLYIGLAVLIFALAIILLVRYLNRKNKNVVVEPVKPKIPAHITALARLEKIKREKVWTEGRVKEYYSSISDTIRLYIEERFNVHALESTTDEIMKAFRTQVVDQDSKDKLKQLLTLSDLVKFAKLAPIEAEHEFTLQNAFDFVNGTKREEEVTLSPEQYATAVNYDPVLSTPARTSLSDYTVKQPVKNTVAAGNSATVQTSTPPPKKRLSRLKVTLLIIFAGIFNVLLIFFIIKALFFSNSYTDKMQKFSDEMNSKCPIMFDPNSRLDSTSVLPGKVFQYHFTLVNISSAQVDAGVLKQSLQPLLLNEVKNNPALSEVRDNNTTVQYLYHDKNGVFLVEVTITPADYKQTI